MTKILKRNVVIPAKFFEASIEQHILDHLRGCTADECTKDIGYILNIRGIRDICGNYISPENSETIFTVEFEATTMKPEIGDILPGIVKLISPKGVFIEVNGKMKVFIPIVNLPDYVVDENQCIFIHKTDRTKKIQKMDEIMVKITNVQYSDHKFICFGIPA